MANLTLCRVLRTVSGLSKFVPRNDRLLSTYNCRFIGKIEPSSLCSSNIQSATKLLPRTIHQQSSKILSQLPVISAVQSRSMSSDHVRLWQVERAISGVLILLMPAVIIKQSALIDVLFATLVVMHAHWGLEAVVVDYARPSVIGPILPKVAFVALYLFSAISFLGLLTLVYSGPGIGKTIRNFWSIGSTPAQSA